MSLIEIKDRLKRMSKMERHEILHYILSFENEDDLTLTPGNRDLLEKRLVDIDQNNITLIDGNEALNSLAKNI